MLVINKELSLKNYISQNPQAKTKLLDQVRITLLNSSTTIEYALNSSSNVIIKIYNSLGEEIKEIENTFRNPGNYKIIFDASDLVSGVYYYKLFAENYQETKKLIYLK